MPIIWSHDFDKDVRVWHWAWASIQMCDYLYPGMRLSNPYMWGTPTKQGTSDILDEMSSWYHCNEHTFSFNLIPNLLLFEIQFVYKTKSGYSESVILRNRPLKLPHPLVLDLTGCRKYRIFFVGKCLEISQKLHGGERKHISIDRKSKISKSTDESFFHPYDNSNCPYLKIGWCDLLPVLLECITYEPVIEYNKCSIFWLVSGSFQVNHRQHWMADWLMASTTRHCIVVNQLCDYFK